MTYRTDVPLVDWVQDHVPSFRVASVSEPNPVLRAENVIAVSDDPERARAVLRDWERIENADGAIGLIVMSRDGSMSTDDDAVDPERVASHAVRRIMIGAVPGAVIGAAAVAVLTGLLTGWSMAVLGAALGGGAFGAIAGAVWSFVAGTGWSQAYTEGFVPPDATDLVIASMHADAPDSIDDAIQAASSHDGVRLFRIGSGGVAVPVLRP